MHLLLEEYSFETKLIIFQKLCFHLLSVQFTLHLYGYVKEWRKKPHWSFSCCLALLLPLNDLQGDILGLAGTNVLKTQLDSGEFEMTTLRAAVQGTGALDVTLEEVEEVDDDTVEVQDNGRQGVKYTDHKHDQGTQTIISLIFTAADVELH